MGRAMERVVRWHGCTQAVASRAAAVVVLSAVLVAVLALGMLRLAGQQLLLGIVPIDNDFMSNFALRDSQQWDAWKLWEAHFPAPRAVELLVQGDIMQPEVMAAVRQLERDVQRLVVQFEDTEYGYAEVCHRAYPTAVCSTTSLFAGMGPWADATFPLPESRDGVVDALTVVGATEPGAGLLRLTVGGSGSGAWTGARSYSSVFYLDEQWSVGDETTNPSIEWELAFIEFMSSYNRPALLTSVHYQATRSFSDELLNVVEGDLLLLLPTAAIMVIYSTVMLRKSSPVKDARQSMLAASSVLSPLMATPAAWGLLGYFNMNMNVLRIMAPFIALAVGIDNSFVMISFVERLEVTAPTEVPQAVGKAMMEAGPAIFLTMATDVLAFSVATLSNVGMLKGFVNFCLLMSLALVLNYLLQITMYTALISLDLQRKLKKKANAESSGRSADEKQKALTVGKSSVAVSSASAWEPDSEAPAAPAQGQEEVGAHACDQPGDVAATAEANEANGEQISALRSFLGGAYSDWLSRPGVSLTIVLLAVAVLAISIYSATLADVGMPENYFLVDGAELAQWNDAHDRLFGGGLAPVSVIVDTDYALPSHVAATEVLVTRLRARQDVVVVDSWLLAYVQWQSQVMSQMTAAGLPVTDDTTSLAAFLEAAAVYRQDLTGHNGAAATSLAGVSLSRLVTFQVRLPQSTEIAARLSQYESIIQEFSGLPFDTTVASPVFALHIGRFERVRGMILTTLAFSIVAVFGALLLFILPSAAAICTLNIVFVVGDVLGSVYYLGASFNAITFTTCVMAVGFCVDYSVHMIHFYSHASAADASGKVRMALFLCGPEVLHGATTTLLGTCLLLAGNSYAFRVFARMTVAVILTGVVHGLVVMPAFLSLVGDRLSCHSSVGISDGKAPTVAAGADSDSDAPTDDTNDAVAKTHSADALQTEQLIQCA